MRLSHRLNLVERARLMRVLLGVSLFVTACSPSASPAASGTSDESPESNDGTTVTLLIPSFGNEIFDPFSGDTAAQSFYRLFGAQLVEGDGTGGGLAPGIAQSWEMSPDATTWTFTIGTGIVAHNGEEITAEDVWWNLDSRYGNLARERAANGEVPDPNTVEGLMAQVDSVDLVEPDQVVVHLNQPRPDWAYRLSSNTADAGNIIIPADYFREVGPQGFQDAPVGTGPFRLVSHTPGVEMVFERFDDYYYQPANGYDEDRRAKFDRLIVRAVPDPATRIAALRSGDADVIAANPLMRSEIEAAGGEVAASPEGGYPDIRFVDCWDTEMWCYPKEVRQALEYAIDKETMLVQLYGEGAGEVRGWQWVTPSSVGYREGVTDPLPYDVETAKALLAEAGYPNGDGIPTVKINTWDGTVPFLPEIAQILADSWGQLGIETEVVVGDEQAVRQQHNDRQLSGQVLIRDNEGRWLGSDITLALYLDAQHPNRYCDPSAPSCVELSSLVTDTFTRIYPDEASMDAAFADAYAVLRDDDMAFTPFYLHQPWGLGPRVSTYEPWPLNPYNTAMWTIELAD